MQLGDPLLHRTDARRSRKQLLYQDRMQSGKWVGAGIVQNCDRIITVDRFSEGGKDYAAGRNAAEYQMLNLLRAKDDLQIVAAKGAEAILING